MGISISFKRNRTDEEDDLLLFPATSPSGDSQNEDGQLSVDVYSTDKEIVMRSTIAGVKPKDLEVFVHNDMLTVRGKRQEESVEEGSTYLVRECHWGSFSRSIILPAEVDADNISAELKDGVLTVRMPRVERNRKISVKKL